MQLVGIMTVRNEDDVVAQCLEHAHQYHDVIYVVDCGSNDTTVKVVKSTAAKFPQIIFLGEVGAKHSRQVKRHIWATHRHQFSSKAWWSVVDADEFLHESPEPVLITAEQEFADHIFAKIANFYFTDIEAEQWLLGKETIQDRVKPVCERRKFYRMHTSQIRMFRNLPWLRWNEDVHHPIILAKPAKQRLTYRHYQYRDPLQIEKRIQTRRDWLSDAAVILDNPHWDKKDWKDAVSDSSSTHLKKAFPELPLEDDPELPNPNCNQPTWKTIAKYSYALWSGIRVRQGSSNLFTNRYLE